MFLQVLNCGYLCFVFREVVFSPGALVFLIQFIKIIIEFHLAGLLGVKTKGVRIYTAGPLYIFRV